MEFGHGGHPFRLADWQVSFLKDAFKPGFKKAALSIARRNGKSFLIAVVVYLHSISDWFWRELALPAPAPAAPS